MLESRSSNAAGRPRWREPIQGINDLEIDDRGGPPGVEELFAEAALVGNRSLDRQQAGLRMLDLHPFPKLGATRGRRLSKPQLLQQRFLGVERQTRTAAGLGPRTLRPQRTGIADGSGKGDRLAGGGRPAAARGTGQPSGLGIEGKRGLRELGAIAHRKRLAPDGRSRLAVGHQRRGQIGAVDVPLRHTDLLRRQVGFKGSGCFGIGPVGGGHRHRAE
jgi:hypothetical protein